MTNPTPRRHTRLATAAAPLAVAALAAFAAAPGAGAALLAYEGFNGYTDITVGTTPNANTVGLDQTVAYAGTTPENLSIGAGLTLSNLAVSGGSASFAGGTIVAGAQLDRAAPYVGTLYGSYLINLSAQGTALGNGAEIRISNDDSTGGIRFRAQADTRTNANSTLVGTSYDGTQTDGATSLALNTTYLLISRYTNVGAALSAGTPGVATTYALTAEQYDAFRAAANPEAYLDAAAVGTGASEITARVSDAAVTTGTFSFADGNRLQFVEVGDTGRVDEIRFGSTLADVVPVPEPTTLALAAIALPLLASRRRRATR